MMPSNTAKKTQEQFLQSRDDKLEKMIQFDDDRPFNSYQLADTWEDIHRVMREYDLDQDLILEVRISFAHALLRRSYIIKTDLEPDYPRAKRDLERVIGLLRRIDVPIAYYRLGHIAYRVGDFAEAVSMFDKALRLKNPEFGLQPFEVENARKVQAYCALRTYSNLGIDPTSNPAYQELNDLILQHSQDVRVVNKPIIHKIWKDGKLVAMVELTYEDYIALKDKIEDDPERAYLDLNDHQANIAYQDAFSTPISETQKYTLEDLLGIQEGHLSSLSNNTKNKTIGRLRETINTIDGLSAKLKIENTAGSKPKIVTDLQIDIFQPFLG